MASIEQLTRNTTHDDIGRVGESGQLPTPADRFRRDVANREPAKKMQAIGR